jgi:hypothetical protein
MKSWVIVITDRHTDTRTQFYFPHEFNTSAFLMRAEVIWQNWKLWNLSKLWNLAKLKVVKFGKVERCEITTFNFAKFHNFSSTNLRNFSKKYWNWWIFFPNYQYENILKLWVWLIFSSSKHLNKSFIILSIISNLFYHLYEIRFGTVPNSSEPSGTVSSRLGRFGLEVPTKEPKSRQKYCFPC